MKEDSQGSGGRGMDTPAASFPFSFPFLNSPLSYGQA